MADPIYQFDNYILDVKRQRLFRDGMLVNTDIRTIELLTILIKAAPDWIDKNDLLDRLWPNQEITDWALSRLISDTRKLLGDDGDTQRVIKTIRGRGFQFFATVEELVPEDIVEHEDKIKTVAHKRGYALKPAYLSWAVMGAIMVLLLFEFLPRLSEKTEDVTAVINLSKEENASLNNILEDWVTTQDDMFLVREWKHNRRINVEDIFDLYCRDGNCSQIIMITPRKAGNTLSYRYQVIADGFLDEERELISSKQEFLISALRDAVANTMNRSSDYFSLPLGIYMQHSDQTYLDMYRIYINLENTYVTFVAQARRRNELVKQITTRLGIKRTMQFEKFFILYYDQMNKEEKFIFEQIRAMTSGTLYQGNRNILTLLESNPSLVREIPKLEAVRKHLAFWVNKYHTVFLGREDMCLLYVGVEDGVPFPKGVDQAVSAWIELHNKNAAD